MAYIVPVLAYSFTAWLLLDLAVESPLHGWPFLYSFAWMGLENSFLAMQGLRFQHWSFHYNLYRRPLDKSCDYWKLINKWVELRHKFVQNDCNGIYVKWKYASLISFTGLGYLSCCWWTAQDKCVCPETHLWSSYNVSEILGGTLLASIQEAS